MLSLDGKSVKNVLLESGSIFGSADRLRIQLGGIKDIKPFMLDLGTELLSHAGSLSLHRFNVPIEAGRFSAHYLQDLKSSQRKSSEWYVLKMIGGKNLVPLLQRMVSKLDSMFQAIDPC